MFLDMEILAAVHLLTLQLLNWTLKNQELEKELSKLIKSANLQNKQIPFPEAFLESQSSL